MLSQNSWNVLSKGVKVIFGSKIFWPFLKTVSPFLPGISGSLNFDEEETDGEEGEGNQLRSQSPCSEAERPGSASSQKPAPVCSPEPFSSGADFAASWTRLPVSVPSLDEGCFQDLSWNYI